MRPLSVMVLIALFAGAAQAADLAGGPAPATPGPGGASSQDSPPLVAALDQAVSITLPREIKSYVLGSPNVVDAYVVNNRTLVVSGKSFGLTNVIVWDDANHIMLNRQIAVPATRPNSVTVYNGSTRKNLICAMICDDPAPPPGVAPSAAAAPAASPAAPTP